MFFLLRIYERKVCYDFPAEGIYEWGWVFFKPKQQRRTKFYYK